MRYHFYRFNQVKWLPLLYFFLIFITSALYAQHFTSVRSVEGIEIKENGKRVLFYQVKPKSAAGKYERAGYVHPLYSLNEKILTEDMPSDHPYHRGIFWAWHQIILKDKNIADGWMSESISWKPVKVEVKKNNESILLQSEMIWNTVIQNTKPTAIIREKTTITVFRCTPRLRILDFDIQLFALRDSLKIGGSNDAKGYGGFCLRLKLPGDISFTSENKIVIPLETPVLAGPWMDFTGSFEGESSQKTGVVVFGYPTGLNHQYPWILRKEASMQNVPYPGNTPVKLSKKGLKLSYRIIIHTGDLGNEDKEKLYQEYIHQPSVRMND